VDVRRACQSRGLPATSADFARGFDARSNPMAGIAARRVAKLYAAGELFACRHCYGLAYESQQEPVHQRGLGKAQKIRMQMGGSQNMFEPFPDKPKGMHWRTYDRRRGAHDVAEARFLKGSMRFIDRLGRAPRRAPR
jgi:hypothetical protein